MSARVQATVSGPVSGGSGQPFGSPTIDLAARGYVMEEFLVSGTAGSFVPVDGATPGDATLGRDGHWTVEPGPQAEYVSRMYVVRPVAAERFNGVVVANWQNVTAGFDLGMPARDIYDGYAWVGITTQRVAIEGQPALGPGLPGTVGLPGTDPERYGALVHPGDAWSYDIFTQAARCVAPGRIRPDIDPLGGLEPRLLIATGGSQSAMRLGSYLNIAHQRERLFDGFLLTVHWGMCPFPPDQALVESFFPIGDGLTAGSSMIRDDGGVPILVLCSESETMNNYPVRQPDSTTFRFWELAGTAHAGGAAFEALSTTEGFQMGDALGAEITPNVVDWEHVTGAALRHLIDWVQGAGAPPSFPPIDVRIDATGAAAICRDRFGNATGGLRLPEVEAPAGRHSGTNPAGLAAGLFGETVAFTAEQLRAEYPDRSTFLDRWNAAVDALVASGLHVDADALRSRGERSTSHLFTV